VLHVRHDDQESHPIEIVDDEQPTSSTFAAQRMRTNRNNETEIQAHHRRTADLEGKRKQRNQETDAVRERRMSVDRERDKKRRETGRGTETRIDMEQFDENGILEHYCGQMDIICRHCNARHFGKKIPSEANLPFVATKEQYNCLNSNQMLPLKIIERQPCRLEIVLRIDSFVQLHVCVCPSELI
jgi:hypothetical protein